MSAKKKTCRCATISQILELYQGQPQSLIKVLQEVQGKLGYISSESVGLISQALGISAEDVYGVATFYAQFRFQPPAQHNIKVCLGTACHVRGADRLLEAAQRELGIDSGQTTADNKFELERVACVGCCALAPVVVVDNKVQAKMTVARVKKIVKG
jgi:NADH-quinone oxidoreductase subunit E